MPLPNRTHSLLCSICVCEFHVYNGRLSDCRSYKHACVCSYATTDKPKADAGSARPRASIHVDVLGKRAWSTAPGARELETNTPITPDEHFRIGSNTKTFTGTVILQLVDQGKLWLDDPVSKCQPEAPNAKNITMRPLLNMFSGPFNYSEDEEFNRTLDAELSKICTPEEFSRARFPAPARTSPPGMAFIIPTRTRSCLVGSSNSSRVSPWKSNSKSASSNRSA
jgi:hypothetical protein